MVSRRSYSGNAVSTTINGSLSPTGHSLTLTDSTGWPDGTDGDFFAVVNLGQSNEEKILCQSRSGSTVTIRSSPEGRGADDTSAVAHTSGETIDHCGTAQDLDESNAHVADTDRDDHTQYLTEGRHDVEARHEFGAAFPIPSAPPDIAPDSAAGSTGGPADAGHTHALGTDIAGDALAVTDGVLDVVVDDTTIEVSSDTLRVKDSGIGTAKVADGAITDAKLSASGTLVAAWTSYTPTLTNVTIGNGTISGAYRLVGKTLEIRGELTWGSSTSASGLFVVSLPAGVTAVAQRQAVPGWARDDSASALYPVLGVVNASATTIAQFKLLDGSNNNVNATSPVTWATNDTLSWNAVLEVA